MRVLSHRDPQRLIRRGSQWPTKIESDEPPAPVFLPLGKRVGGRETETNALEPVAEGCVVPHRTGNSADFWIVSVSREQQLAYYTRRAILEECEGVLPLEALKDKTRRSEDHGAPWRRLRWFQRSCGR